MILLRKLSHICLHIALYACARKSHDNATFYVTAQECKDGNESCKFWASRGECKANPGYMNVNCPVSCDSCGRMVVFVSEEDTLLPLEEVAKYGKRQKVERQHSVATIEVIRKTIDYMTTVVPSLPTEVISECTNDDELCAIWSALGECTANPEFMSITCGPSCQNCGEEVIPLCPPPGVVPSIQPGKLNEFFQRIVDNAPGNNADVAEGMSNYTVHVHSRPRLNAGENVEEEGDVQQTPWIISLDNFLTEEECKTLIELGQKAGSGHGTGKVQQDGSLVASLESRERTLLNAWCSYPQNCRGEDIPQLIHDRIAKITGVPVGNSEDFQIIEHKQGEIENLHHDYVEMHRDLRCGPRLLTFQLYLSDVEGGETTFPHLQLSVKPKVGKALLWPNVLSSDLKQSDVRMAHETKSVTKGRKFVANAFLHMYEFVDLPCGV